MGATDYFQKPEIRKMIKHQGDRVRMEASKNPEKFQTNGRFDPKKVEAVANMVELAIKEELMYDLPDTELSLEEVRERRAMALEGIPEEWMPELPEGWLDPS